MKVVLDTNVLLSGLMFPSSVPGRVVAAWDASHFDVALGIHQLQEIARVLIYPKIRRRLRWDEHRIEQFIRQLYVRCEVVGTATVDVSVPADPGDAPILASLVSSSADFLVTGDQDLLALADRYPIESPTEFVRRL